MHDHYVALHKGNESYVIAFRTDQRSLAMSMIGSWADNPELSFSWGDAGQLMLEVNRELAEVARF